MASWNIISSRRLLIQATATRFIDLSMHTTMHLLRFFFCFYCIRSGMEWQFGTVYYYARIDVNAPGEKPTTVLQCQCSSIGMTYGTSVKLVVFAQSSYRSMTIQSEVSIRSSNFKGLNPFSSMTNFNRLPKPLSGQYKEISCLYTIPGTFFKGISYG